MNEEISRMHSHPRKIKGCKMIELDKGSVTVAALCCGIIKSFKYCCKKAVSFQNEKNMEEYEIKS